jgi:hypothetical protein
MPDHGLHKILRLPAPGADEDPVTGTDMAEDAIFRYELFGKALLYFLQGSIMSSAHVRPSSFLSPVYQKHPACTSRIFLFVTGGVF